MTLTVKDADGFNVDLKTTTDTGEEVTHHIIDSSALPTGAATAANQSTANSALSAIQTAVETIDNAISGTEMQVDVVTSALPSGAATAANQSTGNSTLSAIQTAVEIIDNIVSGSEAQVDVVAALPAGDNNIGNVDIASALPAGSNSIGEVIITSVITRITDSKTRPADTNAYAAGDVMNESTSAGTNWNFADCARANGSTGTILKAQIIHGADQSTKMVPELWLFSVAPTADNDNAAYTPTVSELGDLAGVISFPIIRSGTASTNSVYSSGNIALPFICDGSDTDLYGVLVIRNTYTPVSAATIEIHLDILQD